MELIRSPLAMAPHPIHHTGSGLLPTPHHSLRLDKVLHDPSTSSNLLSVQQLAKDNNCSITFDQSSFSIQDNHTKVVLHKGLHAHGLYHFSLPSPACSSPATAFHSSTTSVSPSASMNTWHHRLGHPSMLKLQHLSKHLSVLGSTKTDFSCVACSVSKCHRLPFKLSSSVLIHSDVWGPFNAFGSQYKYYVLFIDDFSKVYMAISSTLQE